MTRIIPVPMRENAMKTQITGFERLTLDPEFMNGQPCVRGRRITVQCVLEALSTCPDSNQLRTDLRIAMNPFERITFDSSVPGRRMNEVSHECDRD